MDNIFYKDIQGIINSYKIQLEHTEKLDKVLNELKEYHNDRDIHYTFNIFKTHDNLGYYETFESINHKKDIQFEITENNNERSCSIYLGDNSYICHYYCGLDNPNDFETGINFEDNLS
jgi:RecA-family ATPase